MRFLVGGPPAAPADRSSLPNLILVQTLLSTNF